MYIKPEFYFFSPPPHIHTYPTSTHQTTQSLYQKWSSLTHRLYQKSLITNANLVLKMPPSSPAESDEFMTPNSTFLNTSNPEQYSTPSAEFRFPVMKIQSAGNMTNQRVFEFNENYSDEDRDEVDFQRGNGLYQHGELKRMKSLGNLPLFQRDYGGTPQDILRLKQEFEEHRFGLARMRSLTSLNEPDLDEESPKRRSRDKEIMPVNHRSRGINEDNSTIFKKQQSGNFRKNPTKRRNFGVGDTKFIGSEDQGITKKDNGRKLAKNSSMGMIPDLISEKVIYDPFLTPLTDRKYEEQHLEAQQSSEESFSDVDSNVEAAKVTLRKNDRNIIMNATEANLLSTPFERGFRRSYNVKSEITYDRILATLRQSDGFYQLPPGSVPQRHSTNVGRAQSSTMNGRHGAVVAPVKSRVVKHCLSNDCITGMARNKETTR